MWVVNIFCVLHARLFIYHKESPYENTGFDLESDASVEVVTSN